jgi:hypothetical protein
MIFRGATCQHPSSLFLPSLPHTQCTATQCRRPPRQPPHTLSPHQLRQRHPPTRLFFRVEPSTLCVMKLRCPPLRHGHRRNSASISPLCCAGRVTARRLPRPNPTSPAPSPSPTSARARCPRHPCRARCRPSTSPEPPPSSCTAAVLVCPGW